MRPARGVGVVLHHALAGFLARHPASVDYVALVPEMLWTDAGRGTARRYAEQPAERAMADALAAHYPVVCHGRGLSIGSAMPLDEQHLDQVAGVVSRYGASRYSEHLGFCRVPTAGGRDHHLGLEMPMPCDEAQLDWLADRVRRAGQAVGLPLLLRNGPHHTPYLREDMSEPVFMNRLAQATGCGVLLDLHHLCADQRRHGADPQAYIDQLDLSRVLDIRVAGASPAPARALLRALVPRCPRLQGITLDIDTAVASRFDASALLQDLDDLTTLWKLHEMQGRDQLEEACHVT